MGTRRSSRQRKPLYSTMNEKSPDTANHYGEDRPRRKRRRVEVEEEDDKQVDERDDEQEDEPDEDGVSFYHIGKGIFCISLGAEFLPHSQSKIATFFPNTVSVFFQVRKV